MGEVKQRLVKVILKSGKSVFMREMKISDSEKAAQKVSRQCDGDPLLMQVLMKKVLVQSLLMKIAPTAEAPPVDLSAAEKADLDSLFTVGEYAQLMIVIDKLNGGDEAGNAATVEFLEG